MWHALKYLGCSKLLKSLAEFPLSNRQEALAPATQYFPLSETWVHLRPPQSTSNRVSSTYHETYTNDGPKFTPKIIYISQNEIFGNQNTNQRWTDDREQITKSYLQHKTITLRITNKNKCNTPQQLQQERENVPHTHIRYFSFFVFLLEILQHINGVTLGDIQSVFFNKKLFNFAYPATVFSYWMANRTQPPHHTHR